jgi:hypothetical protein
MLGRVELLDGWQLHKDISSNSGIRNGDNLALKLAAEKKKKEIMAGALPRWEKTPTNVGAAAEDRDSAAQKLKYGRIEGIPGA